MTRLHLVCTACGWTPEPPDVDPYPFRCPNAGTDDGDHMVQPVVSTPGPSAQQAPLRADTNPFIRYRRSLYSWHVTQAALPRAGLKPRSTITEQDDISGKYDSHPDRDYCSIVERIDSAVERIAGTGFRVTPLFRADGLSQALGFGATGGVWVKDETRNVSGSHKARHLMGVALYLEVLRRSGIDDGNRPLAVASCGNAALAAAVVARAINRALLVFVPEHAGRTVVAQLERLGAAVTRCSRGSGRRCSTSSLHPEPAEGRTPESGLRAGDPCYLAFRQAVADGALPFSCQGNENGLVIEGGATIGYEIVDQIRGRATSRHAVTPRTPIPDPDAASGSDDASNGPSVASVDRLFVQVGGGALASACIRALTESVRSGRLAALPRIHAVQTSGGYPLKRAYDRLVDHILERLESVSRSPESVSRSPRRAFASDAERAACLLEAAPSGLVDDVLRYARAHRSAFMWPWETEPLSIATGILDDETYDWAAVVEGMVRTGGFPVVVDEATLREANELARETTGVDVDHTGSSGLAGLLALSRTGSRPRPDECVVVLLTGVRREQSDSRR